MRFHILRRGRRNLKQALEFFLSRRRTRILPGLIDRRPSADFEVDHRNEFLAHLDYELACSMV